MKKKRVLAIIPARGGSKGIPRKNIKLLNGRPLIYYTIKEALESNINKILVSTDDTEIKKISQKYGAEVMIRPKKLAQDDTSSIDVVIYILKKLEQIGQKFDIFILLQPTSPLRTKEDINEALNLFIENECESVISVNEVEHNPYWSFKIKDNYLQPLFANKYLKMRRQELPKVYMPNGAIFISKPSILEKKRTFYIKRMLPYIINTGKGIDIDTEQDFKIAEYFMSKKNRVKF